MTTRDTELLDSWRRFRDRGAMDQLIRRHINFVYGAARRMMRSEDAAEDVTQAVFMLLIQKSPRITSDFALASWLHRTTRFACSNARRMAWRRNSRDARVARSESIHFEPFAEIDTRDEHDRIAPLLDEAIGSLPRDDRVAVLMSVLLERSHREIGEAIGSSEEAARKRIERALARLRERFVARGIAFDDSIVRRCTFTASPALLQSTLKIAPALQLATHCLPCAQLAERISRAMLLLKLKLAAAACLAVIAGASVTTTAISQGVSSAHTLSLAPEEYTVHVDERVDLTVLGVANVDAGKDDWFNLAGEKIGEPPGPFAQQKFPPGQSNKQLIFQVSSDGEPPGYAFIGGSGMQGQLHDASDGSGGMFALVYFRADPTKTPVNFELLLASGPWRQVAEAKINPDHAVLTSVDKDGNFTFTHPEKCERGARAYISHEPIDGHWKISALDTDGRPHQAIFQTFEQAGKIVTERVDFDLAPEDVTGYVVETRDFNHRVTVKDVCVDPTHPTKPQIQVDPIERK